MRCPLVCLKASGWTPVQEEHGHARIPEDLRDVKELEWLESACWITRNARLFAKGKLSEKSYHLIRTILGKPQLPTRMSKPIRKYETCGLSFRLLHARKRSMSNTVCKKTLHPTDTGHAQICYLNCLQSEMQLQKMGLAKPGLYLDS